MARTGARPSAWFDVGLDGCVGKCAVGGALQRALGVEIGERTVRWQDGRHAGGLFRSHRSSFRSFYTAIVQRMICTGQVNLGTPMENGGALRTVNCPTDSCSSRVGVLLAARCADWAGASSSPCRFASLPTPGRDLAELCGRSQSTDVIRRLVVPRCRHLPFSPGSDARWTSSCRCCSNSSAGADTDVCSSVAVSARWSTTLATSGGSAAVRRRGRCVDRDHRSAPRR